VSPADLYQTAAAALLIGALIGAFGIGGVLLAPWLTHVIGLPVHEAVAITMLSFVAPGAVALARAAPAMRRSMPGRVRLVLATAPGALAGSAALWIVPERAALVVLAVATSAIGVRLLVAPEGAGPRGAPTLPRSAGGAIGFFVGFGSAITATGGPMVLTPLALWRGLPLAEVIALGQIVQLPIAATASIGNLLAGTVDALAGMWVGAMLVPGMLVGQRVGRVLPVRLLAIGVGLLLVAAGVAFALKAA
jgi:uncharacterized membrane protein YfcA